MLIFYPENLPIWNDYFDFQSNITLVPRQKTDYATFNTRDELIQFLKRFGIVLTDPNNPLEFIECRALARSYWNLDPHRVVQGNQVYGTIAHSPNLS